MMDVSGAVVLHSVFRSLSFVHIPFVPRCKRTSCLVAEGGPRPSDGGGPCHGGPGHAGAAAGDGGRGVGGGVVPGGGAGAHGGSGAVGLDSGGTGPHTPAGGGVV